MKNALYVRLSTIRYSMMHHYPNLPSARKQTLLVFVNHEAWGNASHGEVLPKASIILIQRKSHHHFRILFNEGHEESFLTKYMYVGTYHYLMTIEYTDEYYFRRWVDRNDEIAAQAYNLTYNCLKKTCKKVYTYYDCDVDTNKCKCASRSFNEDK